MNKKKPCPVCLKEKPGEKQQLFSPRGLKQHLVKKHGKEPKSKTTTIQITRELHAKLNARKHWGQDFDDVIREALRMKPKQKV